MDLLKLNEKFYLKTQEYFNRSRQTPWEGWKKLLYYLSTLRGESSQALKVLELGCGNGRFGIWLRQHKKIEYVGVDNNQYLLDAAKEKLPEAKLIKQNLLKPWGIKGRFDLIVMMAVLHHIPTKTARLKILQQAKDVLKPHGLLVFTCWHFNKLKRFQNQVTKKLANNDYILDWKQGVQAERYVHLFDDKEISWLVKNLKMKLLADYVSDGQQGQSNRYLVLRKVNDL